MCDIKFSHFMLSTSNILLKISSHTPSLPATSPTHTHSHEGYLEDADVEEIRRSCPNKAFSVWVSHEKKASEERKNMKLIFPSKTLEKKINTRFMWNETEEKHKRFFPFFSGSGVCVMLRCFCESRESFCLFHTNCGKWKNAREN